MVDDHAKTRAIYINSPNNPTGGVLTRADIQRIANIVKEHDLWLLSDEAYEDVVFDDGEHVSPASLPDMYERTISFYTFSYRSAGRLDVQVTGRNGVPASAHATMRIAV